MAVKLTIRQQQVLDIIRQEIQRTGFPPTRAEIAQTLGFRSANAAEDHLKALAKKGAIELTAGASRGIRLVQDDTLPAAANDHDIASNHLQLPIIGRVAAGSPILASAHVEQEIGVAPNLFSQTPDYLLRVRGLSMRDIGILEGDLLAVKKTTEARHGQVIVARLGDDVTVKRLHIDGKTINLMPENPDFDPIPVSDEDSFSVEGIAVGLIRNTPIH
ncbi:transcriptional repressor LexA [Paenalcaligenes sp. Me52]|uniref:transcriptional repressor LexA n=1 Tax=Paenalcaligenes sp. Me52 TaxID=3392038 RepID=UPI003D271422